MNRPTQLLFTLALLAAPIAGAQAQTLFDNGTGPTVTFLNDYYSDLETNFKDAGNVFSPTASGLAANITFDGVYVTDPSVLPSDNFTLDLFSVSGGSPDTVLSETSISDLTRSVVGSNYLGSPVYEFSGEIDTPFQLNTGTSYFLAITDSTPDEFAYVLHTGGPATSIFQYVVPAQAFQSGTGSFAFKVSAAPEPTTEMLVLCALPLFAAAYSRNRRVPAI